LRHPHGEVSNGLSEATSLHATPGQSAGNAIERAASPLSRWSAAVSVSRKVPVIPVEACQSRYLVSLSPYAESEWVRNLRAAGKGELSRKGRIEVFHAVEIPVDERGAIIARYREVAGRVMSPCFTKLLDAQDHPVFEVG
jgi:hypothetical protein